MNKLIIKKTALNSIIMNVQSLCVPLQVKSPKLYKYKKLSSYFIEREQKQYQSSFNLPFCQNLSINNPKIQILLINRSLY